MDGYCSCAINKTTINSDKNLRGRKSILKVVHCLQKINVQVFRWLNNAKFLKSIALRIPESYLYRRITMGRQVLHFALLKIFFWLNFLAAEMITVQYIYGSPIQQALLNRLCCVSLFYKFLQCQAPKLTSDLLFFGTFFSSNNANTNK
jgi:hypothetical protein